MDLDELKYQLNKKLSADHNSRSDADFAALLKKKTGSVIGKLRRSLIIEVVLCVLFAAAMAYVSLITSHWSLRLYFGVFTVLMIVFMFILFYLLRRTSRLSASSMPVKSNLQDFLNLLEEFVKRYFQFTMALLPICFAFSLLLSYADPIRIPETEKLVLKIFSARWQVYVFMIVYITALGIGVYYFTKWYLKKLYGNYLNELRSCIAELKEDEGK